MKKKILINSPKFYGIDEAIRESFEKIGFNAVLLNYGTKSTIHEKIARRVGLRIPYLIPFSKSILKYYLEKENEALVSALKREKPNLLFVIKGDHLFPETLRKIKNEMACPIVSYIWDDPFYSYAGPSCYDYRKYNFEEGMHMYDFIFVYDTFYVEQIRKRGLTNVEYLPLAADPKKCGKIEIGEEERENYGYDLCFVGSPYPNRVEILDSLRHYNLGVFGDGWIKYFLQKGREIPSYYKGSASGQKVLKIYLSSKIVLNIHDPEAREGLNTRTFDILVCGASELVDYKKNLEMHFKIGEEIATFRDMKELIRLVNYYLEHGDLLRDISSNGRQRVLNEHTWIHRVKHVTDTLKERGIANNCEGNSGD